MRMRGAVLETKGGTFTFAVAAGRASSRPAVSARPTFDVSISINKKEEVLMSKPDGGNARRVA